MHPDVRRIYSAILSDLPPPQRVIEIGQDRDHGSLIDLPELADATERVAVGHRAGGSTAGVTYVIADANDLSQLPDGHFDLLVCNSMLEHDPRFWRSLVEMRRITRIGGHMVIGVPGFGKMTGRRQRLRLWLQSILTGQSLSGLASSTPTLGLHAFPDDYYRFSCSAVERIFLEGCEVLRVVEAFYPPRLIGLGLRRTLQEHAE